MSKEIDILQYLQNRQKVQLIDVRSPKEYLLAHIPGAFNMPLFSDEERAIVGTTYKNGGREQAIELGLQFVGPKMASMVAQAREIITSGNRIVLHCWRGGMRSKSVATLFSFCGIPVEVLKGGYKSYRKLVHETFEKNYTFIVIGGKTGSAKTKILHALQKEGEQIIDLEKLANHKGSAFGDLGEEAQPKTEMFENLLFEQLAKLESKKRIWVEDESQLIGTIFIPQSIWQQMRSAAVYYCQFPLEERIQFLVENYGHFEKDSVIHAVKKINNRLGGQHAKAALNYYEEGNLYEATKTVLIYYDKSYDYGLSKRNKQQIIEIPMQQIDPSENAKQLLQFVNRINITEQQNNPLLEIKNG